MKAPTFLEGVGIALVAALAGTLAFPVLDLTVPGATALRLVVAGLGLGYLFYLLARSRERIGRITTLSLWLTGAGLVWVLSPSLTTYLLCHLSMIWAVRSVYFHPGLLAALADLGLTGLGLLAAVGAWLHSGSLFLALWSLFLVMALFVFIPTHPRSRDPVAEEDRFQRAQRAAEAAVQKLSSLQ